MGAAIADYDVSLVNDACKDPDLSIEVPPPFCGLTDFTMRCGSDWDTANDEQCGPLCKPHIVDCEDEALQCWSDLQLKSCAISRCGTDWDDANANCRPQCQFNGHCSEGLTCQGNLDCVSCGEVYTGQKCVAGDE